MTDIHINNIFELMYYSLIFFIPFLLKWYSDNKKSRKLSIKVTNIDLAQNKEIESIKASVQLITEFTKDEIFIKKLNSEANFMLNTILKIKKVTNNELQHTLIKGIDVAIKWTNLILAENFIIENDRMQEQLYFYLRSLKSGINVQKLNLKNPSFFLEKIENELLKCEIEAFIIDFQDYKNKINGDRRNEFKFHLLQLIKKIIEKSIDYYDYTNIQRAL